MILKQPNINCFRFYTDLNMGVSNKLADYPVLKQNIIFPAFLKYPFFTHSRKKISKASIKKNDSFSSILLHHINTFLFFSGRFRTQLPQAFAQPIISLSHRAGFNSYEVMI